MIIRPASTSDVPAIIDLLKLSLGESLIPKSEKLWHWKHIANPFGKSPVLLAEEDGEILGVRAFLRWEFLKDDQTIKACRAVDTATHPKYQGKGIFSKLTLSLVEEMKKEGVDLIYNTPNTQSAPGYLKMGWESWGKLPLKLNFHLSTSGKQLPDPTSWADVATLIQKIEADVQPTSSFQTKLVPGYLAWRYRDNPLYPYQLLTDGESFLLIYRIKEGKMGREFRICDLFAPAELSPSQRKKLKTSLSQHIKASGARFSSFSGLCYPLQKELDLGLLPVMKVGPLVTLRQMKDEMVPSSQPWAWSLGDLEVF
jgi:N-acetylglutamate synthase-like GNAT family acetyltransferase